MSEQNILNPTPASEFNPEYPIKPLDPRTVARAQARYGKPYYRRLTARGPVLALQWNNRLFSTYNALKQWFAQYEMGFFSLYDIDRGRYYSGMFDDEPQVEVAGNDKVNISSNFVVIPGMNMYQYPGNWSRDAVFREERDDFGQDLVKLTGSWDRRDQNYALFSEDFSNGAWQKSTGVTITPNLVAGPNDPQGVTSADAIVYDGSGAVGDYRCWQTMRGGAILPAGVKETGSIWLRTASGSVTVLLVSNSGFTQAVCNVTTSWLRFPVTSTADGVSQSQMLIRSNTGSNAAFTIYASAAQFEFGTTLSTYTKTGGAPVPLIAPNADAGLHGGFAYWNPGTSTTDSAEWLYMGYGFRLWSFKAPYMGICNVFLDGVFQSAVDLYAAAATASAPVLTVQNVPFNIHRVKLQATNTANGSASAKVICADAIEVMR